MFLLEFRHIHSDETLGNKKKSVSVIKLKAYENNINLYRELLLALVFDADLLEVFMHVTGHLLSQLGFSYKQKYTLSVKSYSYNAYSHFSSNT